MDLAVQFHQAVVDAGVIPDLLKLLCGLASRAHEQLAACGVVAFKRLLINGAPLMKEREWHQCMEALQKAFDETTPNFGVFSDETTDGDATRAAIISVKTQTLLVSAANDCRRGNVVQGFFQRRHSLRVVGRPRGRVHESRGGFASAHVSYRRAGR